jgi:hypothetical protein
VKLLLTLAALLGFGLATTSARAEDPWAMPEGRAAHGFASLNRPTGIAEAGAGWLTLPGASVCAESGNGSSCRHGDTSFVLDAWQLFRSNLRFAFGAGLLLGLIPTTDAPESEPPGITRDHTRKYLTLEGTIRYYPYVGENFEFWTGLMGGLVVVDDHFEVKGPTDDLAFVGQRGATIRTEGGTIGLAVGTVHSLAPNWSLGLNLRYGNWFLPTTAAHDPLTDRASLRGRNTMFALGLSVAYRVNL